MTHACGIADRLAAACVAALVAAPAHAGTGPQGPDPDGPPGFERVRRLNSEQMRLRKQLAIEQLLTDIAKTRRERREAHAPSRDDDGDDDAPRAGSAPAARDAAAGERAPARGAAIKVLPVAVEAITGVGDDLRARLRLRRGGRVHVRAGGRLGAWRVRTVTAAGTVALRHPGGLDRVLYLGGR